MPSIEDLSLEQRAALRSAAANLRKEFDGTFGVETIEQFLATSYDQFADQRPHHDVPAAHGRTLRPPAPQGAGQGRRQGQRRPAHRAVPLRPQRRPLPDGAGLVQPPRRRPRGRLVRRLRARQGGQPAAVLAMAEVGIDIAQEFPKPWTDEIVQAADVVVTMGCGDACPSSPASATRTGASTTPPARTSTPSDPSATRSKHGCEGCSSPSGVDVA